MNPIEINAIDHVVLRVKDLDAALAFYRDALGLTIERQLDIGLVQLRAGASLIDLVPVSSPLGQLGGAGRGPTGHNMDHFALELASLRRRCDLRAYLDARAASSTANVARATAQRALDRRFTSRILTATQWN